MGMQVQGLTADGGFLRSPQEQLGGRRAGGTSSFDTGTQQTVAALPGSGDSGADGELRNSVSDLSQTASLFGRRLQFEVDHESQDVTIKIIDRQTDRVIRVLPPEELQRLHRGIREALGSFVDQSV
ncbi:MAG: flagellar protein FlaG [Treponema sp.]|jgi:flagellar protein FlaG|nr:flagellar protein FlaG [Treponema sp.]